MLLLLALVGAAVFFLTRGDDGDDVAAPAPTDDQADVTTEAPATDDTVVTTDPPDCSPVTVWAAPEIVTAVESAADRAATDCFAFEVEERETTRATTALRDGETPDVWVPGSAAWSQLATGDGVDLEVGEPVASSPVLLVTAPETLPVLESAGITGDSSFAELTSTYRELAAAGDAPFVLRMGDPRVDAASMALLSGTRGQEGGWAAESDASREALVRLAQTAVQGDPLSAVQADPSTVVPVTEQQLAQADGGELQGLTLADGAGVVRMPFVTADGAGSPEAVAALEQELRSDAALPDLAELGLRAGRDGAAPDVAGAPDGLASSASDPSADDVTATADTWAAVAPESRILTVVDISGSMEAEIEGTTRIDLARTAVQTAVSVIPEQTTMGLWYFATALDGQADHAEQVPLRPLEAEVDGGTQKELLLSVTEDLGPETLAGDTGLHDALWAAYQAMQTQQTQDSISSVLLLTDGVNDDSTGGLTEDEVVGLLAEARASTDSPVNVVLIGMGPDVDEQALQRLAEAAGGETLVLRDPSELPQVFVDVVANRAQ
ncbi:substrate-binding domain-containing protein [Ornithinimicrobium flavum]|uniref:substrate-binding domain-containing protein n=1 Tax=Ornithinimicrobium flavum TaxID=1288636 RepID=UPI0013053095|nr:substrate-binding domain-containing protein [Ornithinimicrobium flavum]